MFVKIPGFPKIVKIKKIRRLSTTTTYEDTIFFLIKYAHQKQIGNKVMLNFLKYE